MAYCPARPPELTLLLTIHLFPHSPTRASSSNSIFILLLLRSPSHLTPWIVHRNFPPKFLSSYTFSLSSNSLDDIFRSPSLSLTPPPPSTFIPTHYDYKFTSLLPLSLTHSHLPPFPTPPALHSFTVLWILPLRWAFCCHYFEPLLE